MMGWVVIWLGDFIAVLSLSRRAVGSVASELELGGTRKLKRRCETSERIEMREQFYDGKMSREDIATYDPKWLLSIAGSRC